MNIIDKHVNELKVKKEHDEKQNKVDIVGLRSLKVLNENNQEILFSSLWEKSSIIVVFIRHFSCISCRAHVDQVWNTNKSLNRTKTRIVFLGNGSPRSLKHFKKDLNLGDAEIYTDPKLKVFDACGMNRGLTYLMNFKSMKSMVNLSKEGYSNGSMHRGMGSHRQLGGVVAFKSPGIVLYHFISEYVGDFDNPEEWPEKE